MAAKSTKAKSTKSKAPAAKPAVSPNLTATALAILKPDASTLSVAATDQVVRVLQETVMTRGEKEQKLKAQITRSRQGILREAMKAVQARTDTVRAALTAEVTRAHADAAARLESSLQPFAQAAAAALQQLYQQRDHTTLSVDVRGAMDVGNIQTAPADRTVMVQVTIYRHASPAEQRNSGKGPQDILTVGVTKPLQDFVSESVQATIRAGQEELRQLLATHAELHNKYTGTPQYANDLIEDLSLRASPDGAQFLEFLETQAQSWKQEFLTNNLPD